MVGFFVGQLPRQVNETNLIAEITRRAQHADALQARYEQIGGANERLKEKLRNVHAVMNADDRIG